MSCNQHCDYPCSPCRCDGAPDTELDEYPPTERSPESPRGRTHKVITWLSTASDEQLARAILRLDRARIRARMLGRSRSPQLLFAAHAVFAEGYLREHVSRLA